MMDGKRGLGLTRELKLRRRKKSNRGRLAKQQLHLHVYHAFLYISLPSLHDYNMKMPNFTF